MFCYSHRKQVANTTVHHKTSVTAYVYNFIIYIIWLFPLMLDIVSTKTLWCCKYGIAIDMCASRKHVKGKWTCVYILILLFVHRTQHVEICQRLQLISFAVVLILCIQQFVIFLTDSWRACELLPLYHWGTRHFFLWHCHRGQIVANTSLPCKV